MAFRTTFHHAPVLALALLAGCAGPLPFAHDVEIALLGDSPVQDLRIAYGSEDLAFPGTLPAHFRAVRSVHTALPRSMTVSWTVQGQPQNVVVPLHRQPPGFRLENWRVYIQDRKLEVWREEMPRGGFLLGNWPPNFVRMYPAS
jgi:hypothetical protein